MKELSKMSSLEKKKGNLPNPIHSTVIVMWSNNEYNKKPVSKGSTGDDHAKAAIKVAYKLISTSKPLFLGPGACETWLGQENERWRRSETSTWYPLPQTRAPPAALATRRRVHRPRSATHEQVHASEQAVRVS